MCERYATFKLFFNMYADLPIPGAKSKRFSLNCEQFRVLFERAVLAEKPKRNRQTKSIAYLCYGTFWEKSYRLLPWEWEGSDLFIPGDQHVDIYGSSDTDLPQEGCVKNGRPVVDRECQSGFSISGLAPIVTKRLDLTVVWRFVYLGDPLSHTGGVRATLTVFHTGLVPAVRLTVLLACITLSCSFCVRKKRTPRLAIEKLVDPEFKRNCENQLLERLPGGPCLCWRPGGKSFLAAITTPPIHSIMRRQVKLSIRTDREACWTRKAGEMEDTKNAGNVCKLFRLMRSTGLSETCCQRDNQGPKWLPDMQQSRMFGPLGTVLRTAIQLATCYLESRILAFNRKVDR
ncbi:hypothetical protein CLF_112882 [Clonorchis sinensis]|uniref:Uncharacterized protein n=1 Tax=Clonorchis sinensis TaxID=79923 RepID=G7YX71_CLOSI|nr:hypothetical protein CLF_112882 [Clonorchis sinensis]